MLVAKNISKNFGGIKALERVNLEIDRGKVNAIIGENGAGKSTLMKILSGVYADYEGDIFLHGNAIRFLNPRQAQEAGIAIIHQELSLIPQLTITENIFLGRELTHYFGGLNQKEMRLQTKKLLQRLKLDLNPDTPVYRLKVGQQQVVEIAKALLTNAEVIIMDEPTSAISDHEVEILFRIIDDLRKENKAIVYISHKLNELFKIADCYTVLRDGKTIESGEMHGVNKEDIIRKMVGRNVEIVGNPIANNFTDDLLLVKDLNLKISGISKNVKLSDISLHLKKGEILGIFGLMGAGRTEFLESLFGMHAKDSTGDIFVEGTQITLKNPSDAIRAGIALVPEDRKKDGLVLGLNVKNNISLTVLDQIETAGILSEKKENILADKYIGELGIKTSSKKQLAKNLSGGNQQKVVISKWLATHPRILLLDEPTRGIDVNAKNEIYKLITALAKKGLGIIMVSSELPEILAISNRVVVFAEGVITAEMPISEAKEENILQAAIPRSV
ncbi:sugar ABC transporter ATP-binding protein [Pararhodonellum marinum]|uniref:sugar ABC transporter ATP-binding protein n=1 Tax=Pararhodonellum marinum TaxID=2755358 RepID=UPI001890350D|nr:sugar ABC transporter ATP-binding protein [Pararhodonellum marinum]